MVLAGLLELKGDYEGAISEYEVMLKQDSGSMVVANNLASLLTDHRTDRTKSRARLHLRWACGNRRCRSSRIRSAGSTTTGASTRRHFPFLEEAATELPTMALVRYHTGMNYVALGETAKASEHLKKALELASAELPLD